MFIFRGVNIYPGQIASVLEEFREVDSEFQIRLLRKDGRDQMVVKVERKPQTTTDSSQNLSEAISIELRKHLLVRGWVEILPPGSLPRSCGKTRRVIDDRNGIED
jgi:phenylacetate-CoA ligase